VDPGKRLCDQISCQWYINYPESGAANKIQVTGLTNRRRSMSL